ncbi:MAG TPA: hypothetical protein VFY22_02575, partial [Hydrogenophaga sp.]|nr:hypothetical protein [Hydrogenophaga sp.]
VAGMLVAPLTLARTSLKPQRLSQVPGAGHAGREMQVFQVKALGLEIWVDNQPTWDAEIVMNNGRPVFAARPPELFDPPAAFTVAAWPEEKLPDLLIPAMARNAIQTAAPNFGLSASQASGLIPKAATYGVLKGREADFVGRMQGIDMDVRIFVGQSSGRYPVVLTIYTPMGRVRQLADVIDRSWGQLAYMA